MERFDQLCRENNLKVTPQREAIYKALKSSKQHPSADLIFKKVKKEFPHISLDTVNRTLITFAKVHIVDIVEGHGDPRRFDPNKEKHHHFYCLSCHGIFDFQDETINMAPLPEAVTKKFTVTGRRLCLRGYCEECANGNQHQ